MRYEILVAPDAGNQLAALPAHTRSEVRDGIELNLRFEPTKLSKSRIKRRKGLDQPLFYDVTDKEVQVLAIVAKAEAQAWLDKQGTPTPPRSPSQGQG